MCATLSADLAWVMTFGRDARGSSSSLSLSLPLAANKRSDASARSRLDPNQLEHWRTGARPRHAIVALCASAPAASRRLHNTAKRKPRRVEACNACRLAFGHGKLDSQPTNEQSDTLQMQERLTTVPVRYGSGTLFIELRRSFVHASLTRVAPA